jgi:type I restriction-modification system DNA methylase subunit
MGFQKYAIQNAVIPQGRRQEMNNQILHMIDTKGNSISAEQVLNSYTGNGGLHGLNFGDFDNFHQYSAGKKAVDQGQFFTPHQLCRFIVACIKPRENDLIADLTCGMGNFFNYLPNEKHVYGVEIDSQAVKVARYLYPAAHISTEDVRFYHSKTAFDIVLGNPPFNLSWKVNKKTYSSQLFYFFKAYEVLKPGGFLAVITPKSFLSDDFGSGGDIKAINKRFNFICQFELPRNSFRAVGVASFETKVLFFQRKSQYLQSQPYETEKIEIEDISEETADQIHDYFIEPMKREKNKFKAKLHFESKSIDPEESLAYQVKKLLYDIKRNPQTNSSFNECLDYYHRYQTQRKPDGMKPEEWELIKITPEQVINYLRKKLQMQNYREIEKTILVKTKYGLELKPYSRNQKHLLTQFAGVRKISFNEMISEDRYPFADQSYFKLFTRKKKAYHKQNLKLSDLPGDLEIRQWLNDFTLQIPARDLFAEEKIIRFNDRQKIDLETILQKRYPPILNWQMGSGKTLAGIAWYHYLQIHAAIRNVFVVSPAISINLTWKVKLQEFGKPFILLEKLTDIRKLQPGQVILISFDMLVKYQRLIKKYIHRQSQKVAVIVDESDELTNFSSARTQATLNVFRRVGYKLLMTGTTTRNNINEIYPQLELLYNNSINLLNTCKFTYKLGKEDNIISEENPYFGQPFPAWRGNSLFKACFCPFKVSVFGIRRFNQDIYNINELKGILEKSVLTRTFEEIAGAKKYEIITHSVAQNSAEREVYRVIVEEFYRIMNDYYENTGNSRKESGLKIVRQIQLLIKSTSFPHLLKEYRGEDLPGKYYKIFDLIRDLKDEKVAIGTVFLKSATDYYRRLKLEFPDRKVFLIKGDVSFKNRKSMIQEFEASSNGILISTQQALKSSANIGSVDHCILESIQWNLPKIFQYAFRFIRYDSQNFKHIHFVTYEYSIEQNLLGLLMTKEQLNEFIKTLEYQEREKIFDKYGIDISILERVMEKETDSLTGKVRLTWGQTKVS